MHRTITRISVSLLASAVPLAAGAHAEGGTIIHPHEAIFGPHGIFPIPAGVAALGLIALSVAGILFAARMFTRKTEREEV